MNLGVTSRELEELEAMLDTSVTEDEDLLDLDDLDEIYGEEEE
ncbi:MAG: hypothetical protein P8Y97_13555 [Candidatus Lokiarchaeota archaeon]